MDVQPVPNQKMTNLPNLTPLCFIAEHYIIRQEISPWLVQVICLVASPPNLLHILNLLIEGTEREAEKALVLCKHSSGKAKTVLFCQHCSGHKPKTQNHTGCEEN